MYNMLETLMFVALVICALFLVGGRRSLLIGAAEGALVCALLEGVFGLPVVNWFGAAICIGFALLRSVRHGAADRAVLRKNAAQKRAARRLDNQATFLESQARQARAFNPRSYDAQRKTNIARIARDKANKSRR